MTQMLRGQRAAGMVQIGLIMICAFAGFIGSGLGQVSRTRALSYHGAATVSVATLRVSEQAWKHFEKARVLSLKHQSSESERECEKALAIAPAFPAAHILEASQQVLLTEYAAAISHVAAARRDDAGVAWAGVILAGAYNGLRRYDDARNELQALPVLEASSWQANYEETRAAIGLGDKDAALKLSLKLLAMAPKDFSDAFLVRTNALIMAQRWSEAAANLTAYLALPGYLVHQAQVQTVLADITRRLHSEETTNLASK